MADATVYHNPKCSKSREAMQVVSELGADVDVVRYLDSPPSEAELRELVGKLEDPPAALVRKDRWSELGITSDDVSTVDGVVAVLLAHPELMQRPGTSRGGHTCFTTRGAHEPVRWVGR